jgi:uncharacterized protein YeaO (DUF488 family)
VGEIRLVRVHDDEQPGGRRYLVDRVWPRGVRKADLALDGWLRDVAPSTELRRWFGHDPQRWAEFHRRYTEELEKGPSGLDTLVEAVRQGDVTLLYSARDREHNQAVVLRDFLRR